MTFIRTIPEPDATGPVRAMYQTAEETHGHIPNLTKAFSLRPEIMAGWMTLLGSIKGGMDPRRYELVTMAAAKALRSSYCMLAHGAVLLREHYSAEELQSVVGDQRGAVLNEADQAIMHFAEKVVRDASSITEPDIVGLRRHGLSDTEIFEVAAAAAARCFFSKTLDAVGVRPDASYHGMGDALREALTVGRPIADPDD